MQNSVIDFSSRRIHSLSTSPSRLFTTNDFVPHPPEKLPMVDIQLEDDLIEAERRVMLYEKEVELLREKMALKEEELLDEQNERREERSGLLGKIAQFTNLLAQRDAELAAVTAEAKSKSDIEPQRVRALEDELQSLRNELNDKISALAAEQLATAEIRKRFEDANDALEFEQNNFEKERKTLQRMIDDERERYRELETKSKQDFQTYERSRDELVKRVQIEEDKVRETKAKWSETQDKLKKLEGQLTRELEQKTKSLLDREQQYEQEVGRLNIERTELQQQIQSQQDELIRTQKELVKEQSDYQKRKEELDKKLVLLSTTLERVEKDLSKEKANFSKEKKRLEQQLKDEIRVGKLKKRQMKERYDEIRNDMTSLWENTKRQARREENRLRKKYRTKIDALNDQVAKLEADLASSRSETQAALALKTEQVELREASLEELRANVSKLNQTVVEKDGIIRQQQVKIDRYESSYRSVFKLGVIVTGKKLRKVGRPLKRLIQGSSSSALSSSESSDSEPLPLSSTEPADKTVNNLPAPSPSKSQPSPEGEFQ